MNNIDRSNIYRSWAEDGFLYSPTPGGGKIKMPDAVKDALLRRAEILDREAHREPAK